MITAQQVNDFKEIYCNENKIIPVILKEYFANLVTFPLLDVGSGLGEISSFAFTGNGVHHLDTEDFSFHEIDPAHTREVGDFYKFIPQVYYPTMMISHTLQFIDNDLTELDDRINSLNPEKIIIVRNTNKDFMGTIMNYFDSKDIPSNPERIINKFPKGYTEKSVVPFTATLTCLNFELLSKQISYLWDMKIEGEIKDDFIKFLKENLEKPTFEINQEIILYEKQIVA